MKRLIMILAMSGVAHADSVKPPAGWAPDEAAAVSLARQIGPLPHFGGLPSIVHTTVYRPAAGGSLFVTKLGANAKSDERDRAATVALLEIDASMKRGSTAKSLSDSRAVDAAAKQLVASRRWTDTSTGVVTDGRIVIAADAQQLVAVMGECVLAGDAPADVVTACQAALATLDPEIPYAARVPLAIHVATVDATPPLPPAGSSSSGPSLGEGGERPSLPPMQIPQDSREPDRRPIFVGFGLIVLALVFYWNRKNREKLERAYETRSADQPAPEKPAKSDRDADDLHAAAEDDTKESK